MRPIQGHVYCISGTVMTDLFGFFIPEPVYVFIVLPQIDLEKKFEKRLLTLFVMSSREETFGIHLNLTHIFYCLLRKRHYRFTQAESLVGITEVSECTAGHLNPSTYEVIF